MKAAYLKVESEDDLLPNDGERRQAVGACSYIASTIRLDIGATRSLLCTWEVKGCGVLDCTWSRGGPQRLCHPDPEVHILLVIVSLLCTVVDLITALGWTQITPLLAAPVSHTQYNVIVQSARFTKTFVM